ncbi:MAG: fructosamine kinase family protein [Ectothiorhodospiraceae bacterium]|nr:fructosamine kinase family protein [Ectothiorhodospiraceae bacterium]
MPWSQIAERIGQATGHPFRGIERTPVAGGSINAAYRLGDGRRNYFVKLNRPDALSQFQAESDGLRELAAAGAIRVPAAVDCGLAGERAFLVLEWITLHGRGDWAALGEGLAHLHECTARRHGWHRDNAIGATPQPNPWTEDWGEFFATQRLGHQLTLAEANGAEPALIDAGRRLQEALPLLFRDHAPSPSLLHGDLWTGNIAFDDGRRPVLYDPAVHYGDRECDLAMSELFGRLPEVVYRAYHAVWPLDPGYPTRRELYQLYHVLNHFNLFGGGYGGQAVTRIRRLLTELGCQPCGG